MNQPKFAHLFTGEAPDPTSQTVEAPRYRLLLVDDEPGVLNALRRVFRQERYEVVTCDSPTQALELLQQQDFQLMISDYMMPGMTGGELLRQARNIRPDTMRIMLTGHADVNAVVGAVKTGAVYKFILKPWNDDDLRITVALAFEQYELRRRNRTLQQENQARSAQVDRLLARADVQRSHLAVFLSKKGLLREAQLQELLQWQQANKEAAKESPLREIVQRGWATERQIFELLARESGVQQVSLEEVRVEPGVAALIPARYCQQQHVVPVQLSGQVLTVAMADPLDGSLLEDLRFITGLRVVPALASYKAVQDKLAELYQLNGADVSELEAAFGDPFEGVEIVIEDEQQSVEELLRGSDEPPAMRLVNCIILEAIRLGASDIHIHPRAKNVMVRLRIDGVLVDKIQIPSTMHQALVSRIKIMAELDISERRRPQDGRITVKTPQRIVDLRISSLPTINGEKLVLRVLDRNSAVLSLEQLGFEAAELGALRYAAEKPQGIVLATGPTGSGKTTTLYSLLQAGADAGKNYVTIEDPVEYYLDSAGQVLVREKIGLTFPLVLRAILRQDPDVLLIGEIRDLETAEVSFHAALTGHQVFSTLHTNSAFDTIARLLDLGLKPFVVAAALEAVVAQRLVRRVCPDCREPAEPDAKLLARLGGRFAQGELREVYRGRGCVSCFNSGYKGRVGIYEVLLMDEGLRALVARGASMVDLVQYAREHGFSSLRDAAYEKVAAGLTSPDEIMRTLGPA